MSAQMTSLKSKPVVAVVLVLLAVVVVANVAYFKPGSKSPRRAEVRVQSSQPLPLDLGDFQRNVAAPQENLAAWANTATPALKRDPFGRVRTATDAVAQTDTEVAAVPTGPAPLVCNAVLLGGGSPTALINGKGYRVGDSVRNYQVVAIGAAGVKLTKDSGDGMFLSVHADRQNTNRGRIVSESNQNSGRGQTRLVEHARSERK